MKVKKFKYNGFMGQTLKGYTPYTATFKEWTNDPGIAKCTCSDGKERIIPTFALENFDINNHKIQEKTGVLFGVPCNS
jgi:hypothetical protein